MKLSDYVIDYLVARNITQVFEVCGGALCHLLDSLYERKDITTLSMHHEQAAAFAAEGFARIKGTPGVAMATSGPGATNLITGIGSCYFDSIPCVFITGQVNTYESSAGTKARQSGFQETDIVSIVRPIVKKAVLLRDPKKIGYYLDELFYLSQAGRPGPVLLDIPLNFQRAVINPRTLPAYTPPKTPGKIPKEITAQIVKRVCTSARPIILVGGGVRASKAQDLLFAFVKRTGIPVVSSLLGRDAFPNTHRAYQGMIGVYGNRNANLACVNADCIIALGTRLDSRQTGTAPRTFARGAFFIHVDIDRHELGKRVQPDMSVCADLSDFLKTLMGAIKQHHRFDYSEWYTVLKKYQQSFPLERQVKKGGIDANDFMSKLSTYLPRHAIICADVGQNQIWAAQSLKLGPSQRFLTQGGMGAMGSALCLGIGAAYAKKKAPIVIITGDGGFQLNIQELQTVSIEQLPIKIIVLNNKCYGMVRQFQEQYFKSRFQSTVNGYNAPDFQKVSRAFGVRAAVIKKSEHIAEGLRTLFKDPKPVLMEVMISQKNKVLPKLAVNRPLEEQDPKVPRDILRSHMFIDLLKDY
jgi:acetolactate synthase I/II/III large subunit